MHRLSELLVAGLLLAYASSSIEAANFTGISPDNTKILNVGITDFAVPSILDLGFFFNLETPGDLTTGASLIDTAGAFPLPGFPLGVTTSVQEYVLNTTNPDRGFFPDLVAGRVTLNLGTTNGLLVIGFVQNTPEPSTWRFSGIGLLVLGIWRSYVRRFRRSTTA